jgi:thioredoxin 1
MISISTIEGFDTALLDKDRIYLVDFWGPSCAPCIDLNKTLESLEPEFANRLTFVKVNADELIDISAKYGVRGLPTLIMIERGEMVERWVGAAPRETLRSRLEKALDRLVGSR